MSVSELYKRVVALETHFALDGDGEHYSDRLLTLLDRLDLADNGTAQDTSISALMDSVSEKIGEEAPVGDGAGAAFAALQQALGDQPCAKNESTAAGGMALDELVSSLREKIGDGADGGADGTVSAALNALERSLQVQTPEPDAGEDQFAIYQQKVEGTNINSRTLLATDYLNHFNEIVMTLDLVPDMPDLIEDAKEWAPKSYKDHFLESSIADNELAAECYDHVPAMYREPFDMTVMQIERLIAKAIGETEADIAKGNEDLLRENTSMRSKMIQKIMDTANAIIAGHEVTLNQSEIDNLLDEDAVSNGDEAAKKNGSQKPAAGAAGQDDIDNIMEGAGAGDLDQSAIDDMFP